MNHFSVFHITNMVSVFSLFFMRELVTIHVPCFRHWCFFTKLSLFLLFHRFLKNSSWFFSLSSWFVLNFTLWFFFSSPFQRIDLSAFFWNPLFSTSSSSLILSLLAPCLLVLLLSLFNNLTLIPFTMFILVKDLIRLPLHHFLPVLTTSHAVAPWSVLLARRTNFPSLIDLFPFLLWMIWTGIHGNVAITSFTLGFWILFL